MFSEAKCKEIVQKILDEWNKGELGAARRKLRMSQFVLPEVTFDYLGNKMGISREVPKKQEIPLFLIEAHKHFGGGRITDEYGEEVKIPDEDKGEISRQIIPM